MDRYLFTRLFEVQILHEYYLTHADSTSVLDNPAANIGALLPIELEKFEYNLTNDIIIEPTGSCKQLLKNYHLKFAQNHAGFIVGAEVTESLNSAGDTLYQPIIALGADVSFQFTVRIKQASFDSFTNQKLKGERKIYYFNNIQEGGNIAPQLSKKVGDFVAGESYEMGELARHGSVLKMANKNTSTAIIADWDIIKENPYVNEKDRYTPKTKKYVYKPTNNNVNQITATLKNTDGTLVKSIIYGQTEPIRGISLDFSLTDDKKEILDSCYNLEITGNNGYHEITQVYLTNHPTIINAFAVIEIKTSPTDDFKIIEGNLLSTKKSVGESKAKNPIFRLLFKSRQTYWKYISSKREPLIRPALYVFLDIETPCLKTSKPRKFSKSNTYFENGGAKFFLANPSNISFKKEPNTNIFVSEIIVPQV